MFGLPKYNLELLIFTARACEFHIKKERLHLMTHVPSNQALLVLLRVKGKSNREIRIKELGNKPYPRNGRDRHLAGWWQLL